jgi:hypothetical protein
MHYNMTICIKKKKLPHSTQNKMYPLNVNVSLNSETKLFSRLLVDCCTFGITQYYKIYGYVLHMIRRCVDARRKNNDR